MSGCVVLQADRAVSRIMVYVRNIFICAVYFILFSKEKGRDLISINEVDQ